MSVDLTNVSERDQRFHEIVLSCLEALDSSRKPMREELLALYPEFAAELTKFLDDQERVDGVAVPLRQAIQAHQPKPGALPAGEYTAPRELGDFRILREVGRGGMGVVYEAEQLSLGRRVALKVLPFAATMDPRHLQRFQNEARAAASLEHPHIVPVYGVGCERGVHYYAMKFIDGLSLAEIIAGMNDESRMTNDERLTNNEARRAAPDVPEGAAGTQVRHSTLGLLSSLGVRNSSFYRTVAEWGIQAAEALEHAHSLGIVHRDIKPANLLIENCPLPTAHCQLNLWVTDFGLARTAADAGLTVTGDVLGTLRYMSPEQALAKHGLVDHRTDVYSLGVTLYELLTGKPAVNGRDREEILNAITLDEPSPPRTLDASIPAELETIVLKALEKNPTDRYATAQELADDFRRFLRHEPIRARRPSTLLQLRKWGQRHRIVVASAAVCLFVVAVVLAISTLVIWQKQRDTDAAYHAAEEQRREADKQRNEAVASLKDAQAAVDQLLYRVGTRTLADVPQMEPVRREVLTDALGFYKRLLEREHASAELRLQTARAWIHAGQVHLMLGDATQAEESTRQGIAVAEELLQQKQGSSECQQELAEGWIDLSTVHIQINQLAEAEKALKTAREILVNLVTETPASEVCLVKLTRICGDLGTVYARGGKLTLAEGCFREALLWGEQAMQVAPENPFHQQRLATVEGNLGKVLDNLGQPEEGEKHLSQAVRFQEKLVTRKPSPTHRACLANLYRDVGLHQRKSSQLKEAAATQQKAVDLWSLLQKDFPHVPDYAQSYARVLLFSGKDLMALGRDRTALEQLSEAERLYERLVNDFPKIKDYARELAWCCADRAWLLAASNNPEVRRPAAAVAPAKRAVALEAQDSKNWAILGMAYYRAEQWQAALLPLVEAGKRPVAPERIDLYFLAMTYWKLGNKEEARKSYGQAETWRLQHLPARPELPGLGREAAQLLGIDDQLP
jgi:serine/threonine protein kinase